MRLSRVPDHLNHLVSKSRIGRAPSLLRGSISARERVSPAGRQELKGCGHARPAASRELGAGN
jgi:hypothetical protein